MNYKIKKNIFSASVLCYNNKLSSGKLADVFLMFIERLRRAVQPGFMAVILVSIMSAGLFTFVAGCGKKAPPLPPLKYMPAPPVALTYNLSNDRIILKWTYNDKKNQQSTCRGFRIFRVERDLSGNGCKGCPLQFKKIAEVSPDRLNFTEKIKKGFQYYYRIRAYSENNVQSSISNTVEVKYP